MKDLNKQGMDRREFLKRAGIAAAGLGLVACAPAAAPTPTPTKAPVTPTPAAKAPEATPTPSEAELAAKLYEAAKKEGELMVYANGTMQELEEIFSAFENKYPGVKASGYAGTSEAVRDKVLTEARARKAVGDILVKVNFADIHTYVQEGVLETYLSPQLKYHDPKYYDPKGLWYVHGWYMDVIEYNTKAIPKEQAPKSYQDLLKPEFKGKLGLEANAFVWFSGMLRIMGKDKGLEYMRKLAEQKPRLISGHTSLHKLVVSGEIPVAVYMYHFRATPEKEKGAPVEWVDPVEMTPSDSSFMAVVKNTTHPNAAKLMADFLLMEEGQMITGKQGWIPTRKGVDLEKLKLAEVAKVESLIVTDPLWGKEVGENEKAFREIFGKP